MPARCSAAQDSTGVPAEAGRLFSGPPLLLWVCVSMPVCTELRTDNFRVSALLPLYEALGIECQAW